MNRLLATALSLATALGLASSSCSSSGDIPTGDENAGATEGPGGASAHAGTSAHAAGKGGGTSSAGASGSGSPGGASSSIGGTSAAGGTSPAGGAGTVGGSPNAGGSPGAGGTVAGTGGTDAAGGNGAGGTDSGGSPGMGGSSIAGTSSTGGTGFGGASADLSLAIVPGDAILSPPAGVAPALAYKAVLQSGNGAPDVDVTSVTTFSLAPAGFGSFNGELFTAPAGTQGAATIQGMANGLFATTTLTITPPQVILGPGAGPGDPGKFGGAPGTAPTVVYPADGVLVPPNMNSLEFHFLPAPGQTLFSLDFESANVSLSVYFTCTPVSNGCVFAPDGSFWKILANTARGGAPVSFVLRGVDGANPGAVGAAPARNIQFSTQDIVGGLYYWNDGGVIERYDFGFPDKPAQNYLTVGQVGGLTCVGCHVLSRDGTRIIAGHDIPEPAAYTGLDVATTTILYKGNPGGNFFSFSPDSAQYVASGGNGMTLHDGNTGAAIGGPLANFGTMPDWSPDGSKIVFARASGMSDCIGALCAPGVTGASVEVSTFGGSALGAPAGLVPSNGQNNYYPAISPDGQWVIFNRSPKNQDSFSNAAIQTDMNTGMITSYPDGELWIVNIAGGTPIQLATATTGSESWPKWAPNVNTYQGGNVVWATFSSWRPYGLRLNQWDKTQLWMVAIDLDKLAAGQDASFPAFWIPFQSLKTGNHIGQWVTKVQRQPCTGVDACKSGEICMLGRCIPS